MRRIPILEQRHLTRSNYADVRYFEDHPLEDTYTRLATREERKAYSLPKGSTCTVVKLGPGKHARMFQVPDNRRN